MAAATGPDHQVISITSKRIFASMVMSDWPPLSSAMPEVGLNKAASMMIARAQTVAVPNAHLPMPT